MAKRIDPAVVITVLLRLSLGAGLLSAVADRLGIWGPLGQRSVVWGNFGNFLTYTHQLCPWCPEAFVAPLGWGVTIAEGLIGILLILGVWLKPVACCCSALTLVFAISMTLALGIHAPLNYSVFVFSFAAALLGFGQQGVGTRAGIAASEIKPS
jgi:uncharacterized membrane protein YphA (DoxX/SURF4 family)